MLTIQSADRSSAVAAAVMPAEVEVSDAELVTAFDAMNPVSVRLVNCKTRGTKFNTFNSLFDTGSPVSFIRRSNLPTEVADSLNLSKLMPINLGGQKINMLNKSLFQIKFNNRIESVCLIILSDECMSLPMILGRDFLNTFDITLAQVKMLKYSRETLMKLSPEFNERTYFCAPTSNYLAVAKQLDLLKPISPKVSTITRVSDNVPLSPPQDISEKLIEALPVFSQEYFCREPTLNIGNNLPLTEANLLRIEINNCYLRPTVIEVIPYDFKMHIRLTSDAPFHCSPRRLSFFEKTEVQNTVEELLKEQIIRPSESPYASAIVLVKKKNGKTRMCVDYRVQYETIIRCLL